MNREYAYLDLDIFIKIKSTKYKSPRGQCNDDTSDRCKQNVENVNDLTFLISSNHVSLSLKPLPSHKKF